MRDFAVGANAPLAPLLDPPLVMFKNCKLACQTGNVVWTQFAFVLLDFFAFTGHGLSENVADAIEKLHEYLRNTEELAILSRERNNVLSFWSKLTAYFTLFVAYMANRIFSCYIPSC